MPGSPAGWACTPPGTKVAGEEATLSETDEDEVLLMGSFQTEKERQDREEQTEGKKQTEGPGDSGMLQSKVQRCQKMAQGLERRNNSIHTRALAEKSPGS